MHGVGKLAAWCILAFLLGGSAQAAEDARGVQTLESLIVQDYGFEKTFLSFAEERLGLLGRGADLPDEHPIRSVLGMILKPNEWRQRKLFKIDHPALITVFEGENLISAADFMRKRRALSQLVQERADVRPAANDLDRRVSSLLNVGSDLAIIPQAGGEWLTPTNLPRDKATTGSTERAIAETFGALSRAFIDDDARAFSTAASQLVEQNRSAADAAGTGLGRLRIDRLNTILKPFKWSAVFYLFATFLYIAALGSRGSRAATVGVLLLIVGLAAHATGLTFRAILVGRAPVANMYESLVFATGGMVVIAIVLERIYKNPLVGLAGALLGFIFMVIANKMPLHQSRINPLMPALQSSWLTYHVITIMLSYSAFALSFFVSVFYLLKLGLGGDEANARLLQTTPRLDTLDYFNYRIIAVGFPLLTIGIFTGAVWAATAWGRPWAFDPKETWSAITWLIYGVFLHTRLLAGWKGTRSAVLGVVGFAAVLFTYLGVNYLLPGLHSYV